MEAADGGSRGPEGQRGGAEAVAEAAAGASPFADDAEDDQLTASELRTRHAEALSSALRVPDGADRGDLMDLEDFFSGDTPVSASAGAMSPAFEPPRRSSAHRLPPHSISTMSTLDGQDSASVCTICSTKLGKRHLHRRHQCYLCGRAVCSGCSPSAVQLPDYDAPQRACAVCVADFDQVVGARERMLELGRSLHEALGEALGSASDNGVGCDGVAGRATVWGAVAGHVAPPPPDCSLEEASSYCEAALSLVGHLHKGLDVLAAKVERAELEATRQRQAVEELEAKAMAGSRFILRLGERLHDLGSATAAPAAPQLCSLEDAMGYCEGAMAPVEKAMRRLEVRAPGRRAPGFVEAAVQTEEAPTKALDDFFEGIEDSLDGSSVGLAARGVSTGTMGSLHQSSPSRIGFHGDEEGERNCSACFAQLGKRHLRRRYRCELCGQAVCSSCSPSSVQVDGEGGLQRACTPCVGIIQKVPDMASRFMRVADQMKGLAEAVVVPEAKAKTLVAHNSFVATLPGSLGEAAAACEGLVPPMQEVVRRHVELRALADEAFKQLEARAAYAESASQKYRQCVARSPTMPANGQEALGPAAVEDPSSQDFWNS